VRAAEGKSSADRSGGAKVESLGPVKDLAISTWGENGLLVWLE
jgi:hypothetical protein